MIERRCSSALLALAVLLLSGACGGGGGGGVVPPTQPQPSIIFSASGQPVAQSVFLSRGPGSTGTKLVLRVEAQQVSNLYGVAFDLAYPNRVLRFDAVTEGALLSASGAVDTSLQVVEIAPGQLVVGLSRLGPVAGVGGSGVLLDFELTSLASGSGSISFSRQNLFSSSGQPQVGATWIGGSVTVTR